MFKLDRAREYFGAPITITSGYRSPEHNAEIGGVKDSAHTKGMAADLRRPADPEMCEKLAWALGRAGFDRIGRETRHYHVDTDKSKPSPAWFTGESK
jgi:hypothetical protein